MALTVSALRSPGAGDEHRRLAFHCQPRGRNRIQALGR